MIPSLMNPSPIVEAQPPVASSQRSTPALSAKLLAGNTIWNIVGSIAPLAIGLLVMPSLVRNLGTDRFGVLSLAWTLIGYFSLFDLGLGRALTKEVASRVGTSRRDE